MPKFARPNSYNGKQSNQSWTGQTRAANSSEAEAGESEKLYISPATLASAVGDLVPSATTTVEGVVLLTDNNSPVATKFYADSLAIVTGTLIGNNLRILTPGKGIQIKSGAATDSCGHGVLTSGTQTIANTNILAGDLIFLQRIGVVSSTSIGELTYSINPGVSFTVTSVAPGTPGSIRTTDVSTYAYFIVRPL